jgi:predicted nucleic acid-binding protein
VDYVVYDTNIASLAVKGELPASLAARLPGARSDNDRWVAACCLSEGLPLVTRNVKDFIAVAQHHGLTLITE